jgi:hypothetical protein
MDKQHFLDPKSHMIYKIHHTTMEAEPSSAVNIPKKDYNESMRTAVQTSIENYVNKTYSIDNSACAVFGAPNAIVIHIVAEKINAKNMWAGSWSSRWTVTFTNSTTARLDGLIQIHAYYHEGNIHITFSMLNN